MDASWILLGLGFGNLAMLGWLAAAAAPLLIHLWSRRQYREMPWAAMTFLVATLRKHSRRIQLEQWLLLAVRTLLILLIVLAVAEPYGEQIGGFGAPTHRVLVIDTSYSMAYREGDTTRLEKAKRRAAEIVQQSGPADAFTIIALAAPPRQIASRDLVERRVVRERIEAITPSDGRANPAATLELIVPAVTLSPTDAGQFDRQEVHVFTDLQKSTWELDAGEREQLESRLAAIEERAAVRIHNVGSGKAANLAITDLRPRDAYLTVGRLATFDATLREFGEQPRSDVTVEFLVDDIPIGEQTVDVATGGEATVRFTHQFREPGSYAIASRTDGDRLDVDNTRWLAVDVEERIDVLCVGGSLDDVRFLADALNPDPANAGPIQPTTITEGELAETELGDFDCVFLSNVSQLTNDEAERLARYVERGGGLAVFLGDRVVAESYNAAMSGERPILPVRLGEATSESRFGLDPLDYHHPIVAPFRGRERAGLISTPVHRYHRLQAILPLPRGEGSQVALAMPSGEPLIVTSSLGQGRMVLVTTAASTASTDAASGRPWTTWPAWPSFLPIVREILAFAIGGQNLERQLTVGETITIDAPAGIAAFTAEDALEITRPDGRKDVLQATDVEGTRQWAYDDTLSRGVYAARLPSGATQDFAANVDPRESDLTEADPQQLPEQIAVGNDDAGNGATTSTPWQQSGWQMPMLWSAFALVLLELLLAWRFGRGSA